jgi:phage antirepressor YoqD-like protein
MKKKCAATLTIHEAAMMTPVGKKQISDWLRQQAKMLRKEGSNYSTRFRASYLYQ